MLPCILTPGPAVLGEGPHFESVDSVPWLPLHLDSAIRAGQWITISYRTSYYDRLVRPLLRIETFSGEHDLAMNAAPFGAAHWTVRLPEDIRRLLISPTNRAGRFGFAVEGMVLRSRPRLLFEALSRRPRDAVGAMVLSASRNWQVAHHLLAAGAEGRPLSDYHAWRSRHERPLDLQGLDRPRHEWTTGVHLRFVCSDPGFRPGDVADLARTLLAQPYDNWSIVSGTTTPDMAGHNRVLSMPADAPGERLLSDRPDDVLLIPVTPGTRFASYAAAVLAEHAAQAPNTLLVYADEDEIDAKGRWQNPKFKPDWSPHFQATTRYLGRALGLRGRTLANAPGLTVGDVGCPERMADLFARAPPTAIDHLRRVIFSLPPVSPSLPLPHACVVVKPADPEASPGRPLASIVIPSKNRPELLAACLEGLWRTEPSNFEIIVIDNGSTDPRTLSLYRKAARDPRFALLHAPGPFNFSAICNQGAQAARAPLVVFLNNDIEMPSPDWLLPLLRLAAQPSVGAVGPKLLYPSGRVQHAGVVIGLGISAGHVESGAPGNAPGYLGRLASTREVTAVTGACLAIEKTKFDAVGGFDGISFPIELNDIDLCLRLREKGWKSMLVTERPLIHRESASRGRKPPSAYRKEHAAFAARWREAIRDDPFFHPALSLRCIQTALG